LRRGIGSGTAAAIPPAGDPRRSIGYFAAQENGGRRRIVGGVEDQSQKDDMRAALRGDRARALERWRNEGREPVFVASEREPEEPAPEPAAAEPEPPAPPEPALTPPSAPSRAGWLRRLLGRG
jgi:hypothetical protein